MSIETALIANLEGNLDGQYASLDMPATPLAATYTWSGGATVTTPDTSEVLAGDFIRLDSDGNWYQVQSIAPDTSVTVADTYGIGSFPSGATQSSKSFVAPPPPLSGTGGIDPFAKGIADAFAQEPHELPSFTVAGVPSASPAGRLLFVSDESGGAVPAFSDGTDWRRTTDRQVIT